MVDRPQSLLQYLGDSLNQGLARAQQQEMQQKTGMALEKLLGTSGLADVLKDLPPSLVPGVVKPLMSRMGDRQLMEDIQSIRGGINPNLQGSSARNLPTQEQIDAVQPGDFSPFPRKQQLPQQQQVQPSSELDRLKDEYAKESQIYDMMALRSGNNPSAAGILRAQHEKLAELGRNIRQEKGLQSKVGKWTTNIDFQKSVVKYRDELRGSVKGINESIKKVEKAKEWIQGHKNQFGMLEGLLPDKARDMFRARRERELANVVDAITFLEGTKGMGRLSNMFMTLKAKTKATAAMSAKDATQVLDEVLDMLYTKKKEFSDFKELEKQPGGLPENFETILTDKMNERFESGRSNAVSEESPTRLGEIRVINGKKYRAVPKRR